MNPDYHGQLLARADAFLEALRHRHPGQMACREGCSACCRVHLTLFPLEADRVARAVAALPAPMRRLLAERASLPEAHPSCPLLVEDRCAIYEDRPLICRTHGAPLRILEEDGPRTDVCPLNFADHPGPLPEDSLLDLDRLNEILVAVNVYECRRQGRDPGARSSMARIIASALGLPGDGRPSEVEEVS